MNERIDLSCPLCQAEMQFAGDEKPGDEVFCSFCGAPCKLAGDPDKPADWEVEEDF